MVGNKKDTGANSGSRADASSPQAVSTEGFDPARGWLDALAAKAETEVPYCWQIGRYAFFAGCAWGMSLTVCVILRGLGMTRITETGAPALVAIAAFLALRDMSKPWDMARKAAAIAMETRRAETGNTDSVAEAMTARPEGIAQPKDHQ